MKAAGERCNRSCSNLQTAMSGKRHSVLASLGINTWPDYESKLTCNGVLGHTINQKIFSNQAHGQTVDPHFTSTAVDCRIIGRNSARRHTTKRSVYHPPPKNRASATFLKSLRTQNTYCKHNVLVSGFFFSWFLSLSVSLFLGFKVFTFQGFKK